MSKSPDYLLAETIRAALIMIIRAIEKRFNMKAFIDTEIVSIGANDSITGLPQKTE